jgi:hypothetical protein
MANIEESSAEVTGDQNQRGRNGNRSLQMANDWGRTGRTFQFTDKAQYFPV